jgi:hypothetical protein
VYEHDLPRICDALAPPDFVADLYLAHLFEVLTAHGFQAWPDVQRAVVLAFLDVVAEDRTVEDKDDRAEWANGLAAPRVSGRRLDREIKSWRFWKEGDGQQAHFSAQGCASRCL